MQRSIILLAACWLLVCLIHVPGSEAQNPYWAYYRPYDYSDPRPQPIQRYTEQYRGPSIQRPPAHNAAKSYAVQPYQNTWPHVNYVSRPQSPGKTLPLAIGGQFQYVQKPEVTRYNSGQVPNGSDNNLAYQGPGVNTTDPFWRDPKIIEKVHVLDEFLSEDSAKDLHANTIESTPEVSEETKRVVRQVRKERPGFFWTLARITFETFNETRSAIKQISDIIGNNIQPDAVTSASLTALGPTTSTSTTTASSGGNDTSEATTLAPTTTTEAEFVLTRGGIQTLIRRNVLGLVRLFNIEWRDALNESEVSARQFRQELGNQVGTFLQDNPNNY